MQTGFVDMQPNVRRYVALIRQLADGGTPVLTEASGPCPAPNAVRSGACPVPKPTRQCRESVGMFLHSWCGVGLSGYNFILALAKTVTPGGSPLTDRQGQAVPPVTERSSLARAFSRYGKPMTYTYLSAPVLYSISLIWISRLGMSSFMVLQTTSTSTPR